MKWRSWEIWRPYRVLPKPIFIVSAPRSGSTFLFELLVEFPEIRAWHAEMDAIWWEHFPCQRLSEPSDLVGGNEFSEPVGRALRREFYRHAIWAREERIGQTSWREKLGLSPIRYLDKTIANCFHLEWIERAFPDCLYVFLTRDGRATVSSMLEGWVEGNRFSKPHLQEALAHAGGTIPCWSFPAPPGWTRVVQRPLVEVCAWSWSQHVRTTRDWLERIPASRQLQIRYEQLMASPAESAKELARFCELAWAPSVDSFLQQSPLSRTTVSAPSQDKWRQRHSREIESVLPLLENDMKSLGYGVS